MAQRRGRVETFLERNEELRDIGDRKRRRYSQLMARFKRDTLTWTLSQRRRFCGHANSLLRSLKKPERLELHYSGNKLNFRVGLVDARGRRNVLQEKNVYVENANEAGDDLNQDNEIVGRHRHVKRVYRHTACQKRGRSPSGETSELSELGVLIKNKDRMIRK
ncbi:uncharacterized protein [Primulina eburnea]|uniref:uncharacterized protein isoform X2 n=1 Tax=Primulina eburnea TaxID=1245227 RepID=UPI003C6C31F4